jgi:hypothetical protein
MIDDAVVHVKEPQVQPSAPLNVTPPNKDRVPVTESNELIEMDAPAGIVTLKKFLLFVLNVVTAVPEIDRVEVPAFRVASALTEMVDPEIAVKMVDPIFKVPANTLKDLPAAPHETLPVRVTDDPPDLFIIKLFCIVPTVMLAAVAPFISIVEVPNNPTPVVIPPLLNIVDPFIVPLLPPFAAIPPTPILVLAFRVST